MTCRPESHGGGTFVKGKCGVVIPIAEARRYLMENRYTTRDVVCFTYTVTKGDVTWPCKQFGSHPPTGEMRLTGPLLLPSLLRYIISKSTWPAMSC